MSYYGWPCGCPQCVGDEPEEYDDFEEWALDECERQFDMHASHDAEPELRHVPTHSSGAPSEQDLQGKTT